MVSALASLTPNAMPLDLLQAQTSAPLTATKAKNLAAAKANAQDFEAMFLNSMFQHMFQGLTGEGPFGGSTGVGVWRSFLTDEFSKSIAKNGGIGIADKILPQLIALQEANASKTAGASKPPAQGIAQ
jgi:Rod binding domain-containing protein